jgi:hypothetical protein
LSKYNNLSRKYGLFVITVLAEEYGSQRNLHGGNKSKRFKHHTCYERLKVYGMLACVSYDMHVKMAANMP